MTSFWLFWQVGVCAHGDAAKLSSDYGVNVKGVKDLSGLANLKLRGLNNVATSTKSWSLSSLTEELLGKQVRHIVSLEKIFKLPEISIFPQIPLLFLYSANTPGWSHNKSIICVFEEDYAQFILKKIWEVPSCSINLTCMERQLIGCYFRLFSQSLWESTTSVFHLMCQILCSRAT